MEILVLALVAALAFANGANDNSKGVATLVGEGAATPRAALVWAAVTTALGAAVGALVGGGLLAVFRAGFVGGGSALSLGFFAATLGGAVAWVLFATRSGLPVSTTHAILGGLVGAGVAELGAARLGWSVLVTKFALPLATSPLVALALVWISARPLAAWVRRAAPRCLCVVEALEPQPSSGAAIATRRLALVAATSVECEVHGAAARVTGGGTVRAVHWGTSGLVGFARGWNDAPKIAALALVALPASAGVLPAFALVGAAMALGGLVAGRRVLDTLARKITPLPLGESLSASGVSALLVALASWRGLPVSTTHVATGGIVGAGLAQDRRELGWRTVRHIALSWVVTLPAAAALAAGVRFLLP